MYENKIVTLSAVIYNLKKNTKETLQPLELLTYDYGESITEIIRSNKRIEHTVFLGDHKANEYLSFYRDRDRNLTLEYFEGKDSCLFHKDYKDFADYRYVWQFTTATMSIDEGIADYVVIREKISDLYKTEIEIQAETEVKMETENGQVA